jgi:hypothetical protein
MTFILWEECRNCGKINNFYLKKNLRKIVDVIYEDMHAYKDEVHVTIDPAHNPSHRFAGTDSENFKKFIDHYMEKMYEQN